MLRPSLDTPFPPLITPLTADSQTELASGNSPETVFCALESSGILRQLYKFHIAFLFSLIPFLSMLL